MALRAVIDSHQQCSVAGNPAVEFLITVLFFPALARRGEDDAVARGSKRSTRQFGSYFLFRKWTVDDTVYEGGPVRFNGGDGHLDRAVLRSRWSVRLGRQVSPGNLQVGDNFVD